MPEMWWWIGFWGWVGERGLDVELLTWWELARAFDCGLRRIEEGISTAGTAMK